MNNSYITIIKEKRTALSRKRIPLNQNGCTANFRIGVPFEQNLHCFTLKWFHAIIILVKNFDGMKLFLIGGMEDLNFNYCYKITYESGETYDRRRNELSVEISKEDYKKIITGVLQERSIDQIE